MESETWSKIDGGVEDYPAACGRQVWRGFRQSIPSSMYAICAADIATTPSTAEGQTKRARSSRFMYSDMPTPSCQRIFNNDP